ncbi:hypothetical protein DFH08DRAFT_1038406 [Mycena albidolilacea]|uniref:F-box domain-containing protein n=1 Tax=Mycena albidolilacea TaxID=1033008 RepID=A0AAD7AJE1_9AGAR|nr:hypothetical protein DFH08DRAFT_1038406 [Mycena albidolilacea]
MSGVQLLVPELLREILLRLPWGVGQKFHVAQVSRYWRDVALHYPLFWSSFWATHNNRLTIVLERSDTTMLHIELFLVTSPDTDWPGKALAALLPHVARIERLDIQLTGGLDDSHPLSPEPLLHSNLEFPSLKTLRLMGDTDAARILLKAPQLQILDLEYCDPEDLDALLSPGLENIRLYDPRIKSVGTLFRISTRCPRAWRVVLLDGTGEEPQFGSFVVQQPFAPALRELEIVSMASVDITYILTTWLSDVVLHTLTTRFDCFDPHLEHVIPASLRGVGPLVIFDDLDDEHPFLEVGDESGHIRRFRNTDEQPTLGGFRKTVETSILPLQSAQNYIDFKIDYMVPTDASLSDVNRNMSKPMRIAGLAKVKFFGPRAYLRVATVTHVLAHIEPPAGSQVEVTGPWVEKSTEAKDPQTPEYLVSPCQAQ